MRVGVVLRHVASCCVALHRVASHCVMLCRVVSSVPRHLSVTDADSAVSRPRI
jgi:hypothetical protein